MPDDPQKKVSIDSIKNQLPSLINKKKDNTDLLEFSQVENVRLKIELENHNQAIKDRKADRKLRAKYADKIIRFLECYSIVVGLFTIIAGFDFIPFSLPKEVLIALVSSTAIAAIGLVGFIAKGLFDNNRK